MSRRGGTPKRIVTPDPIYKSTVVTKLINQIMLDGKRGTAQRICYDAFEMIGEKTGKDPMEVRPERRQTLALRWMTNFSRARGERTMSERVAGEIMDAANNTGASVRRKEEMHRAAEANKAFAHFRF